MKIKETWILINPVMVGRSWIVQSENKELLQYTFNLCASMAISIKSIKTPPQDICRLGKYSEVTPLVLYGATNSWINNSSSNYVLHANPLSHHSRCNSSFNNCFFTTSGLNLSLWTLYYNPAMKYLTVWPQAV